MPAVKPEKEKAVGAATAQQQQAAGQEVPAVKSEKEKAAATAAAHEEEV